jgi:hypothetical protein
MINLYCFISGGKDMAITSTAELTILVEKITENFEASLNLGKTNNKIVIKTIACIQSAFSSLNIMSRALLHKSATDLMQISDAAQRFAASRAHLDAIKICIEALQKITTLSLSIIAYCIDTKPKLAQQVMARIEDYSDLADSLCKAFIDRQALLTWITQENNIDKYSDIQQHCIAKLTDVVGWNAKDRLSEDTGDDINLFFLQQYSQALAPLNRIINTLGALRISACLNGRICKIEFSGKDFTVMNERPKCHIVDFDAMINKFNIEVDRLHQLATDIHKKLITQANKYLAAPHGIKHSIEKLQTIKAKSTSKNTVQPSIFREEKYTNIIDELLFCS